MADPERDSTRRFSDRVQDYVRYRPGYPDAIVQTLRDEGCLGPGAMIADIGSGTGISSQLFLRHGFQVYAVEPNPGMRAAAERWLASDPHFASIDGTAEATGLATGSVDLIVAGQAFHWFAADAARAEFRRLLRSPAGCVALFWNARSTDATPFLREYEELLQTYGTDYREVAHRNVTPDRLRAFFGGDYHTRVFPTEQRFDLEGLKGRLLSSSYAPAAGHPNHEPMMRRLEEVFRRHQEGGQVGFLYDTELFFGPLTPADA